MTEEQFDLMLAGILERAVEAMTEQELVDRISMTQAATDRLLNEFERRGLLNFDCCGGGLQVPFVVPFSRIVETVLTRERPSSPQSRGPDGDV